MTVRIIRPGAKFEGTYLEVGTERALPALFEQRLITQGYAVDAAYTIPEVIPFGTIAKRVCSFGDSRASNGFRNDSADASPAFIQSTSNKGITWSGGGIGRQVGNYGISGAPVLTGTNAWNHTSRTDSSTSENKTLQDCASKLPDVVHIQYGINDLLTWNGASPTKATLTSSLITALKGCVSYFASRRIRVVFESIQPSSAALLSGSGADPVECVQIIREVNAALKAFTEAIGHIYYDSFSWLANADGYSDTVNTPYYINADATHFNNLAAQRVGREISRLIGGKGVGLPGTGTNFLNNLWFGDSNKVVLTNTSGTPTNTPFVFGVDEGGAYLEFTYAYTAAGGGFRLNMLSPVGQAPAGSNYYVNTGDVIQSQARVIMESLDGGAPRCWESYLRQRLFYVSAVSGVSNQYCDFASTPGGITPMTYDTRIDTIMTTPRLQALDTSANISASLADGVGLTTQLIVQARSGEGGTAPTRVKIYNPECRVVND